MSACKSEKAKHEIGLQRNDLRNVRRDKPGSARLLLPRLRRPHRVAGDADDAVLLAEEVEGLGGLFGQTDDALRRKHRSSRQSSQPVAVLDAG
jgi:hypothetical protein